MLQSSARTAFFFILAYFLEKEAVADPTGSLGWSQLSSVGRAMIFSADWEESGSTPKIIRRSQSLLGAAEWCWVNLLHLVSLVDI